MYQNLPRYNPMYGDRYGFRTKFAPSVAAPNAGPGSINYDVPQQQTVPQSPVAQPQTVQPEGFTDANPYVDHGRGNDDTGFGLQNTSPQPGQPGYGLASAIAGVGGGYGPPGGAAGGYGGGLGTGAGGVVETGPSTGAVLGTVAGLALGVPGLGTIGGMLDPVETTATTDIGGHDTVVSSGSFTPGAFAVQGNQDVSGGAIGSNLGVDDMGNAVSMGYGHGQVDPGLASAAGYSVDPHSDQAQENAVAALGLDPSVHGPGSPTAQAAVGLGYSETGAAPAGSQHSATGVFSTGGPQGPGQGVSSGSGVASGGGGNTGHAASDAAQGGGGGGGGGGK